MFFKSSALPRWHSNLGVTRRETIHKSLCYFSVTEMELSFISYWFGSLSVEIPLLQTQDSLILSRYKLNFSSENYLITWLQLPDPKLIVDQSLSF